MEDIRLGLELNIPKMNQRRFAGMKFLGELYSYQLVESNVVFRALYLMLQFGATLDGGFSKTMLHAMLRIFKSLASMLTIFCQ